MNDSFPRCIECGGTVDSLNEDEEGVPCPACAERLFEAVPGVFHTPWNGEGLPVPDEEPNRESDSQGESWQRADP